MSRVIDASVVVAAVADAGRAGSWAEAIVGSDLLVGPELVLVEATNIIRKLELAGRLGRLEAAAAARDAWQLPIDLLPFEPFSERVWALRANLTSYDAWYVAIAESLGVPLATLDRRLAAASGPRCRFEMPPA